MTSPRDPVDAAALRPTTFAVGTHTLTVVMMQEGRWTVGVDGGAPTPNFYRSQAEAWEAGVRVVVAMPPGPGEGAG